LHTKPIENIMSTFIVSKKTMDRLGSTVNESRSAPVSNMARKAMERMGWTEGKGLGKNNDGIAEHIKIKKRDDAAGLGTENAPQDGPKDNWWMDALGSGLQALNKKRRSEKRKSDKQDEGDSPKHKKQKKDKKEKRERNNNTNAPEAPTMEELFKATGGARLGMRARAEQKGKLLRVEASEYDVNAAATLAKQVQKVQQRETEDSEHSETVNEMKKKVELGDNDTDIKKKEEKKSKKDKKEKKEKKERKE
jgi:Pin2-interacting protein X1